MRRASSLRRHAELGGVMTATLIWAVLFYKNYLLADIPAFGPVTVHLAHLRLVLWRYLFAGGGLFAAWAVVLYRQVRSAAPARAQQARQVRREPV